MFRFALLLLMSLAVSSQAIAAVKWNNPISGDSKEYEVFDGLPCNFFGAEIGAINQNASLGSKRNRCMPNHKGYTGKKGMSVYAERGTAVVAPTNLTLLEIENKSAIKNCKVLNESQKKLAISKNNCQSPYDDIHVTFEDEYGNKFYFYHLMEINPMVPGFGKGDCLTPEFFGTEKQKRKEYNCGGIKKSFFKKGEIIGYVGTTGNKKAYRNGDHMAFAVWVKNHPYFPKKTGWVVPSNALQWETKPSENPLIYLFPISRTEKLTYLEIEEISKYSSQLPEKNVSFATPKTKNDRSSFLMKMFNCALKANGFQNSKHLPSKQDFTVFANKVGQIKLVEKNVVSSDTDTEYLSVFQIIRLGLPKDFVMQNKQLLLKIVNFKEDPSSFCANPLG